MKSVVVRTSNIVDADESALNLIDKIKDKISLKKYSVGILFCAASLEASELIKKLKSELDIPILGCSSSGEISNEGFLDDSAVLMILTDDEKRFYSGVIKDIKEKSKEDLEKIIKLEYENAFKFYRNNKPSIMLTFPNFNSIETIKDIFNIINTNYPELPVFGGASAVDFGDESQRFKEFYDGVVYEGAMPFLFMKTEDEPIITYESISENTKYEEIEDKYLEGIITDCEDNLIKEINNMPAYEFIKNSLDVELERSELFILYPLLITESNFSYTRVILDIDRESGYLYVAGSIAKDSKVSVQVISYDFVERSSKLAMKNVLKKINGKNISNAIVVSCACRKLANIFYKNREVEIIKEHISDDISLIGFYSFGEISPIEDNTGKVYNFYNNETITICLF